MIPRLYAVYITNFGCGPDSFISHFFRDLSKGKPYLQLEIDEHSADAGAITRCEAFLDSLKNVKAEEGHSPKKRKGEDGPDQEDLYSVHVRPLLCCGGGFQGLRRGCGCHSRNRTKRPSTGEGNSLPAKSVTPAS